MTDDELANDRTFLAWLRTSLALIGLSFVVASQTPSRTGNLPELIASVNAR
jgi:uncharacterized membrane protein YidH (DUF202 family)